jgi:hypothetical protein
MPHLPLNEAELDQLAKVVYNLGELGCAYFICGCYAYR